MRRCWSGRSTRARWSARNEILIELETDKVVLEVPGPPSGGAGGNRPPQRRYRGERGRCSPASTPRRRRPALAPAARCRAAQDGSHWKRRSPRRHRGSGARARRPRPERELLQAPRMRRERQPRPARIRVPAPPRARRPPSAGWISRRSAAPGAMGASPRKTCSRKTPPQAGRLPRWAPKSPRPRRPPPSEARPDQGPSETCPGRPGAWSGARR